MAKPTSTFIDEAINAMRGCVALVTGKRDAAGFFDFSQRGLVSSIIAVLIAVLLAGFGPMLLGFPVAAGTPTISIITNAVLFVAQAIAAWIALRQMGRSDGFIPYLVASNWVTLVSGLLAMLSLPLGEIGLVVQLGIVIVAVMTFINIGRFIVTLAPLQIGLLFISQLVGVLIALGLIGLFMSMPALS